MTTSDRHFRRTAADYAKALTALMPRGIAWNYDPNLQKILTGLTGVFGFVDGRAADFIEIECDPRTTNEMLEDWERNWGLPDICFHTSLTEAERRNALVVKMTQEGGQSRDFYRTIGASVNEVNLDIQEHAPYMCGVSQVGDTRGIEVSDPTDQTFRWELGAPEIRFYWRVTINDVLSGGACIINRLRPSHTDLIVNYDSVLDRAASMYPYLGV